MRLILLLPPWTRRGSDLPGVTQLTSVRTCSPPLGAPSGYLVLTPQGLPAHVSECRRRRGACQSLREPRRQSCRLCSAPQARARPQGASTFPVESPLPKAHCYPPSLPPKVSRLRVTSGQEALGKEELCGSRAPNILTLASST